MTSFPMETAPKILPLTWQLSNSFKMRQEMLLSLGRQGDCIDSA